LDDNNFPYVDAAPVKTRPKTIILYIIGGVTFSEASYFNALD